MRGSIPDLDSPHPLGSFLPALFLEDAPFAGRTGDGLESITVLPFLNATYTATIAEDDLPEASTESSASDAKQKLSGVWVLRLEVEPGGGGARALLALSRDGEWVETGTVLCSSDVLTVTTTACGAVEGTYRWRFDGDELALAAVEDACNARKLLLTARPWLRRNLVMRFMSAFDTVLAPVLSSLDNLDAYVDPRLAPSDFVDWLSGWVGLSPTQTWPLQRRRDRIARAVHLARTWGTREGIIEVVSIFAGVEPANVEIIENGAVAASPTPGGEIPGSPEPHLTVRVKVPDPSSFDTEQLRRVVAGAKPAHMPHEVQVVRA